MLAINTKLSNETLKDILEKDYIDRNKYLNGIIKLLNNVIDSKIISLDGDWGSGKTWFLKSLEYLMNNDEVTMPNIDKTQLNNLKEHYMTFYYNAWENDDANSAMLSLIYKLMIDSSVIDLSEKPDEEGLTLRVINSIVKFVSNGSIDIREELHGEKWKNKKITDIIKTSEEIKKVFKEVIDKITEKNNKKLLIIVDEIDRCKPTFAIDLLENIKHFYDDDRVVFIVATNNKQLAASVCKVYGEKYDGGLYLDKFFDVNLELTNNYLEKYIKVIDNGEESKAFEFKSIRNIAKEYNLTMREYNRYLQAMNMVKVDLNNLPYEDVSISIKYLFIPIAVLLRIKCKEKYYEFINGNLIDEVIKLINNEEFFYQIGREILYKAVPDKLNIIEQENVDEELKVDKIKKLIYEQVKIIYIKVFNPDFNSDFGNEHRFEINNLFDMISMMK